MFIPSAVTQQHAAEATLLTRFVAGDPEAASSLFRQLGSNEQSSLEAILEVISNNADLLLWQRLLQYLALHRSSDRADSCARMDSEAAKRADAAIVSLFLKDDDPPAVIRIKSAALSEALADPAPALRHTAATLFGLQGDTRAVNILIEAARAGQQDCRLRAIGALGQLKDERGGKALVEALASEDEEVHWAASQALTAMKEAALPALVQTLKAPKPHVRWHAVCELGDMSDARAVGSLAEALFDDDLSVRQAAAEALASSGAVAVPEILLRITQRALSEDVCQAAYRALQQLVPYVGQTRLQPLLEVLRGQNAPIEAPPIADELLQTWQSET